MLNKYEVVMHSQWGRNSTQIGLNQLNLRKSLEIARCAQTPNRF